MSTPETPIPPEKPPVGILFRLSAISATIFVVTILTFVAMMFGDPNHPVASFLDRNGVTIIVWEVVVTLVLGLLAMTADRIKSLRERSRPSPPPSEKSSQ